MSGGRGATAGNPARGSPGAGRTRRPLRTRLVAASMKPFVKPVPPGESGVGLGLSSGAVLLFLFKRRFWVFFGVVFPLPSAKRLDAGLAPGGARGFRPLLMPTSHRLTSERTTGPKPLPSERSSLS